MIKLYQFANSVCCQKVGEAFRQSIVNAARHAPLKTARLR